MGLPPQLLSGLNNKAEVWRRGTTTQDDFGNVNTVFAKFSSINGRFEFLTGREDTNNQELAVYQQRFIVDGDTDITEADELRFADGRTFSINSVYVRLDWNGNESHRVAYLEEIL